MLEVDSPIGSDQNSFLAWQVVSFLDQGISEFVSLCCIPSVIFVGIFNFQPVNASAVNQQCIQNVLTGNQYLTDKKIDMKLARNACSDDESISAKAQAEINALMSGGY